MRLLFLGDVIGKAGREAVFKHLPELKKTHEPDVIILNGENSAHGFGITQAVGKEFFAAGIDVITTGNHIWDKIEVLSYLSQEPRLIRPHNYQKHLPGSGVCEFETQKGKKVVVINLMGRVFMEPMDDPFASADSILKSYNLGRNAAAIFVDFHGEASSEKQAMAHYLDGRVTAVVGTHTHVPTADERILPKGTAAQTDAGMCGDYITSIIGMQVPAVLSKILKRPPFDRMQPSEQKASVCGTLITVRPDGLTEKIERIRRD
jgi:2',3'-cyclic-nucleotide 2'-phosphodiesterase